MVKRQRRQRRQRRTKRSKRERKQARRQSRRRTLRGGALVTGRLTNDTDSVPTVMEEEVFNNEKGLNAEDPATEGDGT
jgi:hypothetical protein